MTIDRILSIFATIVSVIAVPASGYLSYHYAIKGEKRKEFNEVADVFRKKLKRHEEAITLDSAIKSIGHYERLKDEEFDDLYDRTYPGRMRAALSDAWRNYKANEDELTSMHPNGYNFVISDKNRIIAAIKVMERFCQRK